MKSKLFYFGFCSSILILFMCFCKKKHSETKEETVVVSSTSTQTTSPTYTQSSTGTGNPNLNGGNQTTTGTATITNPATQNSSLLVGGSGWSNATCISTSSITLKNINGATDVTLNFLSPPTSGTYVIAANPASQACALTVVNAPNQPAGVVWYGKTGEVVINTTATSIDASFSGILCTQQNFNFPTVGVSGTMGCN